MSLQQTSDKERESTSSNNNINPDVVDEEDKGGEEELVEVVAGNGDNTHRMKKLSDILASQSKMHSSEALLLFTPLAKGTVLENLA